GGVRVAGDGRSALRVRLPGGQLRARRHPPRRAAERKGRSRSEKIAAIASGRLEMRSCVGGLLVAAVAVLACARTPKATGSRSAPSEPASIPRDFVENSPARLV